MHIRFFDAFSPHFAGMPLLGRCIQPNIAIIASGAMAAVDVKHGPAA
jgi:hypothetical protein